MLYIRFAWSSRESTEEHIAYHYLKHMTLVALETKHIYPEIRGLQLALFRVCLLVTKYLYFGMGVCVVSIVVYRQPHRGTRLGLWP